MSSIRNLIGISVIFAALLAAGGCGSSSPAAPSTSGVNVSSVVFGSSTIAVGGTTQGTVTLAAAPAAAVSVTLTSSNTSVATVASPVTIAAGAVTGTFTVTGAGAGTATISAATGGAAGQSPTLTVVRVALATLTLSGSTVVGSAPLTGTVTLTAPALTGGAAVTLTANDPLSVPATVTVPAGSTTATFTVTSRLVGGTIPGTVTASYGGASSSATVSVTKPTVATASFGITGPTESDTCTMGNGGNLLNCTFNATTSSAPGNIVEYNWSFKAGTGTPIPQTTTGAILTGLAVSCGWLPPVPAGGASSVVLTVTLTVRDDQNNVSVLATNNGTARVLPLGLCGY